METKTQDQRNTNNRKTEGRMLTGMFNERESLERAYNKLGERGYTKEEINLIMSDETRKKHFAHDESDLGNKAKEGAGKGSLIGGTVGTAVGIIAALGTSLVLPGLGIIVAGPIVAGLAGAGAGTIAGGLIGALIGAGIPEDKAKLYESGVKNGRIVMGVHPRSEEDADLLEKDWRSNKAEDIYR
jgi:hypothetical protein